jgi:hypothetical protein
MFVGSGTPSDVVRESISKVPQQIQFGFGNVGTRHNFPLTIRAADGGAVTFRLEGPGNGTLDDILLEHVTVTGTTAASRLTISERGGSPFDLGNLVVNGSLGLLNIEQRAPVRTTVNGNVAKLIVGVIASPNSQELGSLTVTGQVGSLSGNAVGGVMNLGGSKPMKVRIGTPAFGGNENQFTLQFTTTAPINELSVKSADDTASFTAPSIRILRSAGDFSASLTLQGPPVNGNVLGDVKIGGSAISASPDGFNAWITDGNIGSITIEKGVSQMRILAGLILGPNETPSTDSIPATIGRVRIGGAVGSTLIIAGMKENVPGFNPINSVLPGGDIGAITVGGRLSPGSRITAAVVPPIASIEGKKIATASDPRFSLFPAS